MISDVVCYLADNIYLFSVRDKISEWWPVLEPMNINDSASLPATGGAGQAGKMKKFSVVRLKITKPVIPVMWSRLLDNKLSQSSIIYLHTAYITASSSPCLTWQHSAN